MCFQVYLGSPAPCVELPFAEREQEAIQQDQYHAVDLFVERAHSNGTTLSGMSTPHRYHLGIIRCGCGFSLDTPLRDCSDWEQNNHRQLADYVAACLQHTAFVELISCWSGDESLPIQSERRVALRELSSAHFYFQGRQRTMVYLD